MSLNTKTKQEVRRIFDFSPKVWCCQGHCTWAGTLRPVCSLNWCMTAQDRSGNRSTRRVQRRGINDFVLSQPEDWHDSVHSLLLFHCCITILQLCVIYLYSKVEGRLCMCWVFVPSPTALGISDIHILTWLKMRSYKSGRGSFLLIISDKDRRGVRCFSLMWRIIRLHLSH